MNNLAKLIIEILKVSLGLTAVVSNGVRYDYEYILKSAQGLAEELNEYYSKSVKIALIADNSLEWIIIFIAVILSKHHLVLFSPKLSRKKMYNILLYSKATALITDIDELNVTKMPLVHQVFLIENLQFNVMSNINTHILDREIKSDIGISVFTPRSMKEIIIYYDEIVDLLRTLNKKDIYSKCSNYVNYQDFTYNYVMCLLLPLLHGTTIILPGEVITPYSLKYTLKSQVTEIVILTGYQFELLWREYIENKTDFFTEFLYDFKFKRLRRWRIKRHLKQLFPNIQQLIILNSEISLEIEEILKKIKFSYTITYGTVETCGIATYSNPKEFVLGSVGKPLSKFLEIYQCILGDQIKIWKTGNTELKDLIALNDLGYLKESDLFLESRTDETLNTEFGFVISRVAEKALKSLELVTDCILTVYENELIMIANININYCDYKGYSIETIIKKVEQQIHQINSEVETFSKIDKVKVVLEPFSRDSYDRILRDTPFI